MSDDLKDVKADLARVAEADGDVLCRAALREIEALERLTRGQAEQLEIQGNRLSILSSAGHKQADRIEELERDLAIAQASNDAAIEDYNRVRGKLGKAVQDTLDAASAYMKLQYDIGALSHPVDKMRVLQILKDTPHE